ncbi:hypothetical protein M405DRAFT_834692 [Rhizopogon salebrosus TDB-379]|nr:hypothetical protein M405DRAFT_834692 [Rhizopogon salebrosus TDB-379]
MCHDLHTIQSSPFMTLQSFIHHGSFTGIEEVWRLLPKITCLHLSSYEASSP